MLDALLAPRRRFGGGSVDAVFPPHGCLNKKQSRSDSVLVNKGGEAAPLFVWLSFLLFFFLYFPFFSLFFFFFLFFGGGQHVPGRSRQLYLFIFFPFLLLFFFFVIFLLLQRQQLQRLLG